MRRQMPVHHAIVVVDVERFGDPARTNLNQSAIRSGLYKGLAKAFRKSGIARDDYQREDRGDGAFILVQPKVSKILLVTSLPRLLEAEVNRHNANCPTPERMRLRLALHAGEVYRDAHGVCGEAITHAFRLIEAPALKSAFGVSAEALTFIVSDRLFRDVVRHDPAAAPGSYRQVEVNVKETSAKAWILVPGPDTPQTPPRTRQSNNLESRSGVTLLRGSARALVSGSGAIDVPEPNSFRVGDRGRIIPAQLPHDVPGFVGRESELAVLESLVAEQESTTVAISAIDGAAGIGKTALAIHFAHHTAAAFPDGQLFVNLRGFDPDQPPLEPGRVLAGFLRALGTHPSQVPADPEELAALYRSQLSGRRVLVVLDNAANAEQVRPLLPGTGGCLALVTSRNRLSSLAARDGAQRLTLDVLQPDEAVALIARIAGHERTAADQTATNRLVQLCGGLPLALRITADRAAGRRHQSMSDLVDELTLERDRLDVLAAEEKTTQVRAVFSWSYRALPPEAARAFRMLGLHPGFDISTPAASALIGAPIPETRQLLNALTSGHLLEETSRDRYQFHDLVRVYAAECARSSETEPDRVAALRDLITWYLHTADAFFRTFNPDHRRVPLGPPPPGCSPGSFTTHRQAMDWAKGELANLIPVIRCAAAISGTVAWKLPVMLLPVFSIQRRAADLVPELDRALLAARQLGDRTAEIWILHCLAEAYLEADCPVRAAAICRRVRAISTENDDFYDQWSAWYLEGISYLWLERFTDARDNIRQALTAARQAANLRAEGLSLTVLGAVYQHLGSLEIAVGLHQEALAILGRTHSKWQQAYAIQRLASAYRDQGRISDAVDHYYRARAVFREIGDHWAEANTLVELGQTQRADGQAGAAQQSWQLALSIFEGFSDTRADQVRTQLKEVSAQSALGRSAGFAASVPVDPAAQTLEGQMAARSRVA